MTTTAKPATVTEYIDGFPADTKYILDEIRRTIAESVPSSGETIRYGMPAATSGADTSCTTQRGNTTSVCIRSRRSRRHWSPRLRRAGPPRTRCDCL